LRADAEFSTAYNIVSSQTKPVLFEIGTGKPRSADWLLPLHSIPAMTERQPTSSRHDEDSSDTVEYNPTEPISPRNTAVDTEINALTAEDREWLENVFPRIWKGVEEATQTFVPACRRQIDDADKFISTETGLVSAPYTSDKYSGLGVGIQQYADDTQLYVSLSPTDMHAQQSLLSD